MGLKIAKVVYDATKSLMSNPIAKTVGIGAIFGAGVLLGNQVGLDSFERKQQTEVVDSTSTLQNKEVPQNSVVTMPQNEQKDNSEPVESRKILKELDELPIQNKETKTKVLTRAYGDSQYMHTEKDTITTGNVNYNGMILKVEIESNGNKKFYDEKNNLLYEFYKDDASKYSSFSINKYDENNRLIESNSHSKQITVKYKNTKEGLITEYLKDGQSRPYHSTTTSQLNAFTKLISDNIEKDEHTYVITDKNGHLVSEGNITTSDIQNGKIVSRYGEAMEYDSVGRLIKNKSNNESYTYDNKGNIKEVLQDNEAVIIKYTFEYNEQNELVDVKEETIKK